MLCDLTMSNGLITAKSGDCDYQSLTDAEILKDVAEDFVGGDVAGD